MRNTPPRAAGENGWRVTEVGLRCASCSELVPRGGRWDNMSQAGMAMTRPHSCVGEPPDLLRDYAARIKRSSAEGGSMRGGGWNP